MTDKELIRQEIERLINDKTDGKHVAKADIIAPRRSAYLDILQFIDSLPEETSSKDLEEAARHYLLNNYVSPLNDILHQTDLKIEMQYHKDIENAFKAGAEWQHGKDFDDLLQSEMKFPKEYYERGKADMRDEMMKDAVEGIVGGHTDIPAFINLEIEHKPNVKVGDKVKIVVLKTE